MNQQIHFKSSTLLNSKMYMRKRRRKVTHTYGDFDLKLALIAYYITISEPFKFSKGETQHLFSELIYF